MLTMQPLFLKAEGVGAKGFQQYRVAFDNSGKQVEYVFIVDDSDIVHVKASADFTKATFMDPFVQNLYQSILNFHDARSKEHSQ